MAGFWDDYLARKRKQEEKEEEQKRTVEAETAEDGEGDSLSFWAGYQRQKRTGESAPVPAEEEESLSLTDRLAQRGIAVDPVARHGTNAQGQTAVPEDTSRTLAALSGNGKTGANLFTDRIGSTFTAARAQRDKLAAQAEEERKNQTVRNQEWLDALRSPEEIQAELDKAKAEKRGNLWNEIVRRLTNAVNAGNVAVPTVERDEARDKVADERVRSLTDELAQRQWADYERLRNNADFEAKSQYKSTANGKETVYNPAGGYDSVGFDDPLYEYVNGNEDAGRILAMEKKEAGRQNGLLGFLVPEDTYNYEQVSEMTEEERKLYNYIHETKGSQAAYEYLNYLRSDLYARQMEREKDEAVAYAAEHPILSTIGSIGVSPLRGAAYLGQAAQFLTEGEIDQNAPYNQIAALPAAERETVTRTVERNWGKAGSFAYGVGVSMAEFLLNSGISGGNEALSLALMGAGAASDATIEAKERGLADWQSFALGTIAGAAEIITERVSIEKLFSDPGGRPWKYLLQNIFAEGSEEAASDVINLVADVLITQDKSEWMRSVREYQKDNPGMSEDEAFVQVMKDQGLQILYDAAAGAASGGIMAMPGSIRAFAQLSQDRSRRIEAGRQAVQAKRSQEQERGGRIVLPTAEEAADTGDVIRTGTESDSMSPLRTADEAEVDERVAKARNITEATGIRYGVDQKEIRRAERLSRITGQEVEFYSHESENGVVENGHMDPVTGKIWLNAKGKNPLQVTLGHEFTHSLEGTDAYRELVDLAKTQTAESGGDWAAKADRYARLYEAHGDRVSAEMLDQELTADFVGETLFTDERAIREMFRENPSLGKRVRDAIDNFIVRASDMGGIMSPVDEQKFKNVLKIYDRYVRAMERDEAAQEARGGAQAGESVQTGSQQGEVQNVQETAAAVPETAEWTSWDNAGREISGKWDGIRSDWVTSSLEELYQEVAKVTGTTADGTIDLSKFDIRDFEQPVMKLAEDLVDSATVTEDNPDFAELREARAYLRKTPIYYDPDALRAEFGDRESYNRWLKGLFGSMRLTTDRSKGVPADVIFDEFADQFPGYVDLTVDNDVERLTQLADAAEDMKNRGGRKRESNPYEQGRDEAVVGVAVDLIGELQNRMTGREPVREWNRKAEAKKPASKKSSAKKTAAAETKTKAEDISAAVNLGEASGTAETADQIRARAEELYESGEIDESQYDDMQALADELESTGQSLDRSTVERDKGPRGKLAEIVDRVRGRFSLSETEEAENREHAKTALEHFGRTYSWNETGYITRDGDRLDFFGKRDGAPAGSRSMDHREISDAFEDDYGGGDYSGGMIRFMGEGNIRIMPEFGGINIQVEPTEKQYARLGEFIQKNRGEVTLDLDNERGVTVESRDYSSGTRSSKVLNDIREYFATGALPEEVRYSLSEDPEKVDAEYMTAVESGDMETAQRMVEQAARKAGYNSPKLYHGTDYYKEITVFRGGKSGYLGPGIYLTPNESVAKRYADRSGDGGRIYAAWARMKNPLTVTSAEPAQEILRAITGSDRVYNNRRAKQVWSTQILTRADMKKLRDKGYDGIIWKYGSSPAEYMVFESNQLKSANPVTYDGAGNVIPLSQRFNPGKEDIRYSLAEDEGAENELAGLSQKAKSAALRIERQFTNDVLQGIQRTLNQNSAEYRQFRADVARPVTEALLRGEEADPDAVLESTGIDILGQAAARGVVIDAIRKASGEIGRIRTAVQQSNARQQAREARNAEIDARIPDTTEGLEELANRSKDAKKRLNSMRARTLMTDEDLDLAHKIATGQISPEEAFAQNALGMDDIINMAEVEREYLEANAPWERYTKRLAQQRFETADKHLQNADRAKDKASGFGYARETPERNFRDVFGSDAPALIDTYIRPIHKAEAASTRFKNEYNRRVKDLKLSQKVKYGNANSEAAAVQFLGEAEDNVRVLELARSQNAVRDGKTLDEWRNEIQAFMNANPNLDYDKVHRGIETFQQIYKELIGEMNRVLVENGYMPVNVRRGYFPHFNGGSDGVLATFASLLGINIDTNALPTAINGLTSMFKPGKPWFSHAMERTGFQTDYDALEGFAGYLGGVSDVIHQTSNIRNLRALGTRIRYMMGDDQIKRRIDEINADDSRSEQEKLAAITDLTDNGRYKLSRFVSWLDEYTNQLANKKSKYDRGIEDLMGRRVYTWMKNIEGRVAANMISGNLGSALTNFIPLNQAGAVLGDFSMLRGAFDTMTGRARGDGFVERSDFLTNRRGVNPLLQTTAQKISDALSKPMNIIDDFTSETIVRAAYGKYIRQGMDEQSAMQAADELAAGLMADRSKGATPTIFGSHNPLTKLFTQFQVEVNNEFSTIFKDIPKGTFKDDKDKRNAVAYTAMVLLRYFIGAYLFNDLYEKVVGRRAALDPVDLLNDAVGDLSGKKLNNVFDMISEGVIDEQQRANPSEAITNFGTNALEELPFVGGLLGGGRIPISSALPDAETIVKGLTNEKWSGAKKAETVGRELGKTVGTYILPPFAGGAGKKLYQTAENTLRGGRYMKDAEGNDQLQYPYFTDTPLETAGTVLQSALFGPTATEGGKDWVEGGFGNQTAKNTELYKRLTQEMGEDQRASWDFISGLTGLDPLGKRVAVSESGLSDEGKAEAMSAVVSDSERYKFRAAYEAGVSADAWAGFYRTLSNYDEDGNGSYKQAEVTAALDNARIPLSAGEGAAQGLFGGDTETRSLTRAEKAAIWSAYNPKWKTANNPFDASIGDRVVSRIGQMQDEEEGE